MALDKLIRPSRPSTPKEDHWIPLSDLMTGLMMVFMLVAIVFMVKVEAESKKIKKLMQQAEQQTQQIKDVAILYEEMREQLYEDLLAEFRDDLPRWNAKLDRDDLSIRFEEPEVLFDTGKANLKPMFMTILDDFFPRYVGVLSSAKYQTAIDEIRIEGHTSTIWANETNPDIAYFRNMELSQSRTRSVLEYVLLLPKVGEHKQWLTARLTANGLSSSRPRLNDDLSENRQASRRVEFRVRTNAEARIGDILRVAQ
jgi:outer membrane protein OmpA-like peptidoglycan-associated protein